MCVVVCPWEVVSDVLYSLVLGFKIAPYPQQDNVVLQHHKKALEQQNHNKDTLISHRI